MGDLAVYAGLFAVAFVAATLLPAQSEAALAGLIVMGDYSPAALVLVASAGNILGSTVNWLIGRRVEVYRDKRWFPVSPRMLDRATGWYKRYGRWSLLLSWMPVIGDPLTFVAGVLREPLWSFVVMVTVAKTARYLVVAVAVMAA
ncbi:YqaA family protein [Mesorhizobium sp. KR1-2]|uniref:YqaA family protein n=1 Tax=Mesorhizobium sp. KR1-2 TaxID=3156609 RepID=UPI0032B3820A